MSAGTYPYPYILTLTSQQSSLADMDNMIDEYLRKSSLLVPPSGALKSSDLSWFHQPSDAEIPFSNFTTINVAPGHQHIPPIDAIISQQNTQLSTLLLQMANVDEAIQKLLSIRARLEENSDHLRRSLFAHRALTSPARRIPPEVLSEVFYHCLPKAPYTTPRDSESPLVLTQVCRLWRAVAMSTPRLWFSLSIHLQKTVCEAYRRGCEEWLTRAKSVSLSVRVINDINMVGEDPALVSSIVHWLRLRIPHCSDLWWHGPSFPTIFVPDNDIKFILPLERLRITTHRDALSVRFPASAKYLRSASLQCLNHDLQSLDGIDLPWGNLVELNMHFALLSSTLFIQLLVHCGQLQSLVVSCLCADDVQVTTLRGLSPGSITHLTLRRIEIKVIRSGLDFIFDALTLPMLEDLDICFCCRERDAWPHAAFMEMVRRSQCALKRLTVRSNKNAVPHFTEYMEAIPGLAISTSAPGLLSQ